MNDTSFVLLSILVAAILMLLPVGLAIYVSIGPVTKDDSWN